MDRKLITFDVKFEDDIVHFWRHFNGKWGAFGEYGMHGAEIPSRHNNKVDRIIQLLDLTPYLDGFAGLTPLEYLEMIHGPIYE
jgi:hypothetical protein